MNTWFNNTEFAYPLAFSLIALLPLLIWWRAKKYRSKQATLQVSSAYAFPVTSWKNRIRNLPFLLRILALSCLIVALARPQTRDEITRTQGEGIDIMLCMDVSGSMGSRDISPSRLDAAKEVAVEFVRNRPADRIGLVIFSGESFTQCPLTTDRNTLITQIENLESRKFLADGTVIGEGLATAADRLSKSNSATKIIILLTDGKEDAPPTRLIDPLTTLGIVKTKGIKVYTIGLSAAPSTFVEVTNNPKKKKDSGPNVPDEDLLRRISNETGGKYFRARDLEGLKNVYTEINKLEKSNIEVTTHDHFQEKFLIFILAALAFLFLEILLRLTVLRKFP